MTLSGLLGWFAICGAFLAIMASGPAIWDSITIDSASDSDSTSDLHQPPSPIVAAICLSIILWPHVRRRQYGVIAAYTFIPMLALVLTMDLQGGTRDGFMSQQDVVLGALWLSTVVSFPLFSFRLLGQLVERESQPIIFLIYNVAVAMCMVAVLAVVTSFFVPRTLILPVATFGGILGVWLGLFQAVTTSDRLAAMHLYSIPLQVVCIAGLVGAVVGPVVYCWFSLRILTVFPFPMRYSPALGIPAAILAGLWFKASGR